MKSLRTLGAACALALLLAVPVSAGHIEIGRTPPPPPPDSTSSSGPDTGNVDGHIEIGVTPTDPVAPTDSVVTQAALSLLQSVLALF